MKTVVLIPTYNEAENITSLLKEIINVIPEINVLVIDDNSPDGTGKAVEEFSKNYSGVRLISRSQKQGLGAAYVSGFKYAIGQNFDHIVTMDADFSHSPYVIPALINKMKDCDLILGSRYTEGGVNRWNIFRQFLSRSANIFIESKLNLHIKDYTTGFRCYKSRLLKNIDLDVVLSDGYAFQIEMAYKVYAVGGKVAEYPITFTDRKRGRSKLSSLDIIEAFRTVLRLARSQKGL